MPTKETRFRWPPHDPALKGYRLQGDIPGGVFIHGFRSHCDGEKAVALARHAAKRGRSWIRYNQRNCGPGSDTFAHFTIGRSVDDLVSIFDHVGHPVILVGSSLGAVISLQAAQRRPESVCGLLLIAPAVRFVARYFKSLPDGKIDLWRKQGVMNFPDYYEGGEFALQYGFYENALEYANPGPWEFHFPVNILHGEYDELLPTDDSRELQRNIRSPCVNLEIIAGGDHRLSAAIPLMCQKLDDLWNQV